MLAVMPCRAVTDMHMPMSGHINSGLANPQHKVALLLSTRPKLSLDTTTLTLPEYKSTTTLRLDTLSVISPTTRNTLHNSTLAACRSPLSEVPRYSPSSIEIKVSSPHDLLSPTSYTHTHLRSPRLSSRLSPTSPRHSPNRSTSPRRDLPLDASFRIRKLPGRSALKHRTSNTMSAPLRSPSTSTSEKKRVAFRDALTETIQTNTYVTPHSDLLLSPGVDRSVMMLPSPTFPTGNARDGFVAAQQQPRASPLPFSSRTEGRTESRWKAAIEAASLDEGVRELAGKVVVTPAKRGSTSEDDEGASTPVAPSRRKRVRNWQAVMRDDSE